MTETQVNEAQVGTEQSAPATNGSENGSQDVANLKDILGPVFGTEFKTDEDALRSVEAAKNMSGKVGQLEAELTRLKGSSNQSSDVLSKVSELESQLKQSQFFADNPQYNTPEAKELIREMGGDPAVVIQKGAFKTAFDAIQKTNEMEKSKSVLHSNPRLGEVTDKFSQAQEALKAGDMQTAKANAVSAVLDAYEK